MKKLIFILLCFCLMTFGSSARIIEVAPAGAWGVLGISGGGAVAAGGECSPGTDATIISTQDITGQTSPFSLTIPADTTAIYFFWSYFYNGDGQGLNVASTTIATVASDPQHEAPGETDQTGTGVAAWYNGTCHAAGSATFAWAFDQAPSEGPVMAIVYVKGGNTSTWTDVGSDQGGISQAVFVTVNSVTSSLVIAFNQRYGATPDLPSGWTNVMTTAAAAGEYARLSYATAPGAATTRFDSEGTEAFESVVVVSIPDL